MSSRQKPESKILGVISPARAKEFLKALANGKMTFPYTEALRKRYAEIAKPVWKSPEEWRGDLIWMQYYLRRAWDAPNDRVREWYLFSMRRQYSQTAAEVVTFRTKPTPSGGSPPFPPGSVSPEFEPMLELVPQIFIEPPQITPFEAAAFYFQSRIGDRAKHCRHVDCPAPFFIAEKRWQKFCSEACAGPANRESKRKWWHEKRAKGGSQ
jgi:hypothetical protein